MSVSKRHLQVDYDLSVYVHVQPVSVGINLPVKLHHDDAAPPRNVCGPSRESLALAESESYLRPYHCGEGISKLPAASDCEGAPSVILEIAARCKDMLNADVYVAGLSSCIGRRFCWPGSFYWLPSWSW